MSQNFRLFHVSNLSVRNVRIFLLMYTGCKRIAVAQLTLRRTCLRTIHWWVTLPVAAATPPILPFYIMQMLNRLYMLPLYLALIGQLCKVKLFRKLSSME